MAWRCRFLAARPSQVGRVVAEKKIFVKNCRVHPTHWLISTQVVGGRTDQYEKWNFQRTSRLADVWIYTIEKNDWQQLLLLF